MKSGRRAQAAWSLRGRASVNLGLRDAGAHVLQLLASLPLRNPGLGWDSLGFPG